MSAATIERLEADIRQLSLADQLLLMERLVHTIRQRTVSPQATVDDQLMAMASDPEIQREIHLIEMEFAGTEVDGLDETA